MDNIIPLFSGTFKDTRSKLFVSYLCKINSKSILNGFNNLNPDDTPENFNDLLQIYSYKAKSKPRNSRSTDLHPEFYNFVVDIANYHRILMKNTIETNIYQKNLFNHLKNYDTFSNFIKMFYYQTISILDINNNKIYNINQINNINIDLKNCKFVFKEIYYPGINQKINIINNLLPKIGGWATLIWEDKSTFHEPSIDFYVILYRNIYLYSKIDYNPTQNIKNFSLDLDIYFSKVLKKKVEENSLRTNNNLTLKLKNINSFPSIKKKVTNYNNKLKKVLNIDDIQIGGSLINNIDDEYDEYNDLFLNLFNKLFFIDFKKIGKSINKYDYNYIIDIISDVNMLNKKIKDIIEIIREYSLLKDVYPNKELINFDMMNNINKRKKILFDKKVKMDSKILNLYKEYKNIN